MKRGSCKGKKKQSHKLPFAMHFILSPQGFPISFHDLSQVDTLVVLCIHMMNGTLIDPHTTGNASSGHIKSKKKSPGRETGPSFPLPCVLA